jgi:hypothetical protein
MLPFFFEIFLRVFSKLLGMVSIAEVVRDFIDSVYIFFLAFTSFG